MNGASTITKFEEMVNDSLDSTFVYQLLNDAKDEIEAMAIWAQLLKEQTYTVTAGYSYSSALGALPTRFALDDLVTDSEGYPEYEKVDFTDLHSKKNRAQGYFLDVNGGNFHLSGENHTSKTVHLYYTEYSADIDSTGEWAFPSRFHYLLPLKMAQLYYYADAGERGRSWDDKWEREFQRGLNMMLVWNDRLRLKNRRPRGRGMVQMPKNVI